MAKLVEIRSVLCADGQIVDEEVFVCRVSNLDEAIKQAHDRGIHKFVMVADDCTISTEKRLDVKSGHPSLN